MIKAQHWTRPRPFAGIVTVENLQLVEEEISDDLKPGEVLCEAVYLTVDPYMRLPAEPIEPYKTMLGEACLKVIKTRNGVYPLGSLVLATSGWRTHYLSKDGHDLRPIPFDLDGLSPSVSLGVLGMPGISAFFGLRLCQPKSGEICVVNAAAGAVGSIVGQLAKLQGLTVIGFAGSDEKCRWIKEELNFDYAFNYKKISLENALKQAAPTGVDVFFDNVGGDFFYQMISKHMAQHGRVTLCGSIANYNDSDREKYPQINMDILFRELSIHGFMITSFLNEFEIALNELVPLVKKGQLKFKETIFDGFEKMPEAFIGLFKGDNTGKAIVKASSYP